MAKVDPSIQIEIQENIRERLFGMQVRFQSKIEQLTAELRELATDGADDREVQFSRMMDED